MPKKVKKVKSKKNKFEKNVEDTFEKAKKKFGAELKKLESGGGGTTRFVKLIPNATTKVRLLSSNYVSVWEHYVDIIDDLGEKVTKKIACLGKNICPVCASGEKARHRYYFNVVVRGTKKLEAKILACGKQIFEFIAHYAVDSDFCI